MTSEEIKETYSMPDILDRYSIKTVWKGSLRFCSCPFHQEKTPSMQIFERDCRCFSCNFNGDIFDFVRKMEDLSFPEAFVSLGGTYEKQDKRTAINQAIARDRERKQKKEKELVFNHWKTNRLTQICNLLRLYDALDGYYEPFTDEWVIYVNNKQINEHKYTILAFGTREEQNEMRNADE